MDSKSNPADLASRGTKAEEFIGCSIWWNGPDFLSEPGRLQEQDMNTDIDPEDPEVKKEKSSSTAFSTGTQLKSFAGLPQRLEYFSSWHRAKKAVALALRYKDILLRRTEAKCAEPVTVEEMKKAEAIIVRKVQEEAFGEEVHSLRKVTDLRASETDQTTESRRAQAVKKESSLRLLDPFMDQSGVLRVGGRIRKANIPTEQKHPVILPRSGHITELVVSEVHEKTRHACRGTTLGEIRLSGYWIVNGRSVVSMRIMGCVTCKRLRGRASGQKMADLPTDRLEESAPFTYSGVDYFGPFLVNER